MVSPRIIIGFTALVQMLVYCLFTLALMGTSLLSGIIMLGAIFIFILLFSQAFLNTLTTSRFQNWGPTVAVGFITIGLLCWLFQAMQYGHNPGYLFFPFLVGPSFLLALYSWSLKPERIKPILPETDPQTLADP